MRKTFRLKILTLYSRVWKGGSSSTSSARCAADFAHRKNEVFFGRARLVWRCISVQQVILRSNSKTELKNSSISKSYDRDKFRIVSFKENGPNKRPQFVRVDYYVVPPSKVPKFDTKNVYSICLRW